MILKAPVVCKERGTARCGRPTVTRDIQRGSNPLRPVQTLVVCKAS